MKIYNRKAFSLVEMMIVMLIVAVVLAASAPMITRRVTKEKSDKIFDVLNTDPQNAVEYVKGRKQRIFMNAKSDGYVGIRDTGETIPKQSVLFGYNKYNSYQTPDNFIGIGFNTENSVYSVAIGNGAKGGKYGTAIGGNAINEELLVSDARYGTAIGYQATAKGSYSTAIGANAEATANSTAIGRDAKADKNYSVVLGTEQDTVYIPGNLIVGKTTAVGVKAASDSKKYPLFVHAHYSHDGDDRHFTDVVDVLERNHADDYKGDNDWPMAMIGGVPAIQVGPYTIRSHTYSAGYGDNQKWCTPPNASSDWYRIENGACRNIDSTITNTLLYSDARLKSIGEPYTGGLDELNKLNFFNFTFKDDKENTPQVGVIAQDLQKVFPSSVKSNSDGYFVIRWDEMFYSALNAIKDINTKVQTLTENIKNIVNDITDLRSVTEKQQAIIEAQAKQLEEQQLQLDELSARIEKLEKKRK